MTRRTLARLGALTGATALLSLTTVGAASAHVTVTPSTTAAGAYTVLTFSNGHGCEGSPTTEVTIQIPEGVNAATPTRQPFYDVTKQMEELSPPVTDAHGNEITERVDTVTYTATTALPDGYRDAFEVQVQIPEDMEGETLAFPTIQTCQQGETAWTQLPTGDQTEDDLDTPAPSFVVTAAEGDGHGSADAAATDAEGDEGDEAAVEADTEPVSAETDEAAADSEGSGNGLAIAGLVVGAVGVVVGGTALARSGRASS